MNNSSIGIFDSGVGGLSVFKELYSLLPQENYIYFGDTKNLPYGNKTPDELVNISKSIFDYFKNRDVKAVIMACNTTSAITYDVLKDNYNFKIYPVVQTVAKTIANSDIKKVGVFATKATINSHAYKKNIQANNPNIEVVEIACPEWVNIVENELQNDEKSIENIKMHFDEMMSFNVDKIILGCTHYPFLLNVLKQFAPEDLFINPAKDFVNYIISDLKNDNLLNEEDVQEPKFLVSSAPEQFKSSAKLFFDVEKAEEIQISTALI